MKDSMSREGAERLADKIARYWSGKGQEVITHVERVVSGVERDGKERAIFVVRSDMVGGLPRE